MYKHAIYIFKILIIITTLLSLYILLTAMYEKRLKIINPWRFPMLLAILIELYME